VPITTNVVSSNPVHGEVYSIQYYVIKFASDLRQVGGFFPGTPVSFTNETDHHDITEILLKVTLNTINQPTNQRIWDDVSEFDEKKYNFIWGGVVNANSDKQDLIQLFNNIIYF
jgi:hypothetical protein